MLRASWLVALITGIGIFAGLLVSTSGQETVRNQLRAGVEEAEEVVDTSDEALTATDELPRAQTALAKGFPEVEGTATGLRSANQDLGSIAAGLEKLGKILLDADPPLAGVLEAGGRADAATGGARTEVADVVGVLDRAGGKLKELLTLLDETVVRVTRIEAKLRAARAVPAGG